MASLLAMAINILWNKQSGPGGGTRRLHQTLFLTDVIWALVTFGGEIGSTHVVKAMSSLGMISAVIGSM